MKFTSASWRLKHIKLHHPEHIQVTQQKNHSICSVPRRVKPGQHRELNPNQDSVEDLDVFPYVKHVDNIADPDSQPSPPPRPLTETYPSTGAPLSEFIAERWESDAHSCLDKHLQNNPYYPFATREDYKYIQCGIKKK
jgi:hypothetical protein